MKAWFLPSYMGAVKISDNDNFTYIDAFGNAYTLMRIANSNKAIILHEEDGNTDYVGTVSIGGELLSEKCFQAVMEYSNKKRRERGMMLGTGYFQVNEWEVRYHYDSLDTKGFLVGSVVGPTSEGNSFDTLVLTDDCGTELICYLYGIEALGMTEDDVLRKFHAAAKSRITLDKDD